MIPNTHTYYYKVRRAFFQEPEEARSAWSSDRLLSIIARIAGLEPILLKLVHFSFSVSTITKFGATVSNVKIAASDIHCWRHNSVKNKKSSILRALYNKALLHREFEGNIVFNEVQSRFWNNFIIAFGSNTGYGFDLRSRKTYYLTYDINPTLFQSGTP